MSESTFLSRGFTRLKQLGICFALSRLIKIFSGESSKHCLPCQTLGDVLKSSLSVQCPLLPNLLLLVSYFIYTYVTDQRYPILWVECSFVEIYFSHFFAAIGMSPIANDYLTQKQLNRAEILSTACICCDQCFLVQLEEFESQIFGDGDYAYFSSYSDSWLQHAKAYTDSDDTKFGWKSSSCWNCK